MSILKKIAIIFGILLFLCVCVTIIGLTTGVMVIEKSGEISISLLSKPSPLPLDPNDPIIGAYLSDDDTAVFRFYGNGTYIFKSLIHPSASFGQWGYYGNNHYSLSLTFLESEGKITSMPYSAPFEYTLENGALSGSDDRYRKISVNPDEPVQAHVYPTTSANTPLDRQVGVEVKRVSADSIFVKVITGKDVPSLISIRVIANGEEAKLTSGKIGPQVGSMAYYAVDYNTDIVVVAEFYDYTHYNVWAGKI